MKTNKILKTIMIISCAIIMLFAGCANSSPVADESTPDSDTGYTLPTYTISAVDGIFYMNFSDGNVWDTNIQLSGQVNGSVSFKSLSEMKNKIENNDFSAYDIYLIKNEFEKDENGIVICDTNNLYEPVMPNGLTYTDVYWYGATYAFSVESDTLLTGSYFYFTKEKYDEYFACEYEDFFNNPNISIENTEHEKIGDTDATIYRYSTDISQFKKIRYTVEAEDKLLYVEEEYRLSVSADGIEISGNVPYRAKIYGCDNDIYFAVTVFNFSEPISAEWLLSFGVDSFNAN